MPTNGPFGCGGAEGDARSHLLPATSMLHDRQGEPVDAAASARTASASREIRQAMVRQAHRLGVPIAMGTDAGTPATIMATMSTRRSRWSRKAGSARRRTARGNDQRRAPVAPGGQSAASPRASSRMSWRFERTLNDIRALKRPALVAKGEVAYLNAVS